MRPPGPHVAELARYLEQIEIYAPLAYRHMAIFPVRLRGGDELRGGWLTLDQALARGVLLINEKGERGFVPVVVVENRSREDYVFILAGELLAGGKQTRTVRQDLVLAPGQRVDLHVFCVEAHRWDGDVASQVGPRSGAAVAAAGTPAGRGTAADLVRGGPQQCGAGSRERDREPGTALHADQVRGRLVDVRERLLPQVPGDTVGFIVVDRERAVGAEFFGRHALAVDLLPKLLDAYAVDLILKRGHEGTPATAQQQEAAIGFFRSIQQAGSQRAATPGSGAGIRTRGGGLLGDGVSLDQAVVHYGIQIQDRLLPLPLDHPPRPLPR